MQFRLSVLFEKIHTWAHFLMIFELFCAVIILHYVDKT